MVARRIPRQIKKKNVPNLQVKATIKKPLIPTNNGFSFCSAYSWIGATDSLWKSKGFTNMCKKKDDFADEMAELFSIVIPKIYADWKEIFNFGNHNYQYQHCHTLQGKELELSVNIAEIIHAKVFDNYYVKDFSLNNN